MRTRTIALIVALVAFLAGSAHSWAQPDDIESDAAQTAMLDRTPHASRSMLRKPFAYVPHKRPRALPSPSPTLTHPKPVKVAQRPVQRPHGASVPSRVTRHQVAVHVTGSPKAYAAARLSGVQFRCLDFLWTRESGWRWNADNPSSSAYGIPQALPGSKMASAGSDWRTNPVTQVRWGLGYIEARYGSPCVAWAHSEALGWY